MPDRQEISQHLQNLPTISGYQLDIQDAEIWEQSEAGAHFKVTKVRYPDLPQHDDRYFCLSLSGYKEDQTKVLNDFIAALGPPTLPPEYIKPLAITTVIWNVLSAYAHIKQNR
ncbi:hypothetical protein M1563_04915 [Patescibacteria group bacterium]|nr:hypothetical protein [Patescibacteria group bacterium]MCL5409457.1 hypothetical protein [Patescibacteria group bacterium]